MKTIMQKITLAVLILCSCSISGRSETYLQSRKSAADAYKSQNWQEAAEKYSDLVSQNSADGALQNNFGLTLLRLGKFEQSIDAFNKSLNSGRRPEDCHYNIACAYSLAGNKELALDALSNAYSAGFINDELVLHDADLSRIRGEERFRSIVGLPENTEIARTERWINDINFLGRRVKELHWRPFRRITEIQFDQSLQELRQSISELSNEKIRAGIQKLMASIGDGHTSVIPDFFVESHGGDRTTIKYLPIELFWFEDGVRVITATEEFKHLIGAKVMSVGSLAITRAIELCDTYVSRDNEWGARWGVMQALCDPHLLEALDLVDSKTSVSYEFETLGGTIQNILLPITKGSRSKLFRLDEALGLKTPLRYQENNQHLWLAPLGPALYVRIDKIHDGHPETFNSFTERIFATAEENNSKALLIDLRNNLGGQGHLTISLINRLAASKKFNRPGGLYILAGRKTFSAAMAFAAQVELRTDVIFVGEPTGSRPNFVGENSIVRLPYSGLLVSISSRFHQNGFSNDKRFWISPILPAPPSFAAMSAGIDPALEAVLEEMTR